MRQAQIMWCVVDLIVALCALGLWVRWRKQDNINSIPILLLGGCLLGEGLFFLTRVTDFTGGGANLAIQFIAAGVWWQFGICLMRIKRSNNYVRTAAVCMVLAVLLAGTFLVIAKSQRKVAALMFVLWFELSQWLILGSAFYIVCKHRIRPQLPFAACFLVGHLSLYFAHMSLVYLDKIAKSDFNQFPSYLLQSFGIVCMVYALHQMIGLEMFNVPKEGDVENDSQQALKGTESEM